MKKPFTFIAVLVVALLLSFNSMHAQSPVAKVETPVAKVETPVYFDVSPPLREITPTTTPNETEPLNEEAEKVEYPFYKYDGPDPVWQKQMGTVSNGKGVTRNFAGTDCLSGLSPSDDNGDIGPNHYVQMVNSKLEIFSRTGAVLWGPNNINTLFTGVTGGTCNSGDPVVLYDGAADRWMISQFSVCGTTKYMMIAISTTPDPTGSYYRWSYSWGTTVPDYPKFGIWRDSYLLGLNCGANDIAAFDRTQMLAGNASPQVVKFTNPSFPASGWHIAQPCDNDGTFAPYGSPGIFLLINDGAWGGSDQLWVYNLTVNWASPGTASFSRISTLAVNPFDSNFGGTWQNVPQPGTTQKIEVLSNMLMYRAQYRNFGSYQSIVCCHDVDVDGTDHAGIRWYELRNSGGGWYVYQQSTYAPDANHRWMGSISQNASGEIALGFSIASSTMYPSIRYTGRIASDPLGTMTFAEGTIYAGTQSQTDGERWGDYSAMSIDPNDDKTFWYTTQYAGGSAWNWHTRIASFKFDNYCTASGGCDEYIQRVQLGTIDNVTGCDGYRDYSDISTDFPVNSTKVITVTNGNPVFSTDQCGIWVDWNRDNDFSDAGETITVGGSPGIGPYSASIYPPVGTTLGPVRMRSRITYTGTLSPCGATSYGEVEDYTLNLTAKVPNYWVGSFNNYWHQAANWSLGHIPTADEDVYITNAGLQPVWISFYDEQCKNLIIETGGTLEVKERSVAINADLYISGTLGLTNSSGVISCAGTVNWYSGSTANFTSDGVFWVGGDWNFYSGANANLAVGNVDFYGSGVSWIRSYSATCALPSVANYKSSGTDWIIVSNVSTQPLTINGHLFNQTSCNFGIYSSQDVVLKGGLYNNGHYDFTGDANTGTFVFDGSLQNIVHYSTGTGLFNNVRFSSSTGTIAYNNITVAGNLTIDQGYFDPGSTTVTVGGNWTNTVGTSGFLEGASRVIFNGTGHNYVLSSENFNILEANMGAALRVTNAAHTVTCNQYDWTTGGIDVLAGTFTAYDLVDNGLFGGFWTNPGGTINLYQDAGQFVDLDGDLHFSGGGTINVYGGNGSSWWPYYANGSITMSGGVLDFVNNGIYIPASSTYTLTTNITGGTIRTSGGFSGNSPAFSPTGGTFEFYGTGDAYLSQSNGCKLYDVSINKSAKGLAGFTQDPPTIDERSGQILAPGSKSNTILLASTTTITNNLFINAGALNLNGYEVDATSVDIFGQLIMNSAADKMKANSIAWEAGSTDNVNNGEFRANFWYFNDGTNAMLEAPNTAYITSGISTYDADATFGNLVAVASIKEKLDPKLYSPLRVAGYFTITSGVSWGASVDIYVNGVFDIQNGATFSLWSTNTVYLNSAFQLNGTFDVYSGNVLCHGIFSTAASGALYINGGTFIADSPNHGKGWEPLNGNLTMPAGLFEITNNSIMFGSTATTAVSGGILRTGEAFYAVDPGVFQPTGGVVEVTGTVNWVYLYCGNGNYFYNLLINKPSGLEADLLWYDVIVKKDFTIQSGILNTNSYNMNIGGNWTNNVGAAGFVEGTGTVTFDGADPADIITAETFYNLNLNKSYVSYDGLEVMQNIVVTNDLHLIDGTMKLRNPSNPVISGNVTIDLNAGLNAADGYGPQIHVGKNWTNYNTTYSTEVGFHPGTYSIVFFDGTVDQLLTTACAQETFNELRINKASGQFRPNDNITCNGNMVIQNGSWEDNVSSILHHTFYAYFTVQSTGAFYNAFALNTVEFAGNVNAALVYNSASGAFHHLLINKGTGYSVTQFGNANCLFGGNLTIENGQYSLNGNSLWVEGDVAVNDAGVLAIPAASQLVLANTKNLNVNTGGRVNITGTSGSNATIRANPSTARYGFNINSGGTIAADYGIFKNMGVNGVNVFAGGTVDLAHQFKGCTFQDGANNGTLLTINNSQTLTVRNAVFPTNTWSGSFNVTKTPVSGHVYFVDFSGGFSGESYDNDVNNLIDWVPTLTSAATATPASICAGSSSQLNANKTGGLTPYTYLWSPVTGLSSSTILNPVASPLVTTTYYVTVTDFLGSTATSNVLVTVNPLLPVSVTIAASSNPVPPNTFVTFTPTPVNGGTLPTYQWKVNGTTVSSGATYTYKPFDHDLVSCILNSSNPCVTGNPATSNTITMIVVPTNTSLSGTVPALAKLCTDATNTITVAGSGTTFLVELGGKATQIAGVKILYLPTTIVAKGGILHGYITTTNAYCGSLPAALVAVVAGEGEIPSQLSPASGMFSIFPNPTTGNFTLSYKGELAIANVQVELFDIHGNRVLMTSYSGERNHKFTLPGVSPGLYFVKVISGDQIESFKLIVTR